MDFCWFGLCLVNRFFSMRIVPESVKKASIQRNNLLEKNAKLMLEVSRLFDDLKFLNQKIIPIENSLLEEDKKLMDRWITEMNEPLEIVKTTDARLGLIKTIAENKARYEVVSDAEKEEYVRQQSHIIFEGNKKLEAAILFMKKIKEGMIRIIEREQKKAA